MARPRDDIRWFDTLGIDDVPLVGGKNASLGEMYRALSGAGIRVPNGFAITADAYRNALTAADCWGELRALLDGLDISDLDSLARRAAQARDIVYRATDTPEIADQATAAYRLLERQYGPNVAVAVRSSATAEDLPDASFAGQHESFLNVRSARNLVAACRACFASLFTDRAIVYRVTNGFDHFKVGLSVGVMKMVRSDRATSGVIFTLDTESGFRDVVYVTAAYGLGENIVQGKVDPDEFHVHKPTYRAGHRAVIRRAIGSKELRLAYAKRQEGGTTRNLHTTRAERERFCIDDADVLALAGMAITIEDHYSAKAGHPVPMDIEWAKDGDDGSLYIIQARPETVASRRRRDLFETYALKEERPVLLTGKAVGEKIAAGPVRVIRDARDLPLARPGEVLVASSTSPDWEPVMKNAAAIVTDHGGRTCHAAIVARELGVPAVVGTGDGTVRLETGMAVTVSCADGETGRVLDGVARFEVNRVSAAEAAPPRTRIMLNVGNPGMAFGAAMLPNAGVGLARMEFIISEAISVHPMALVHPERVSSARERQQIDALTRLYPSRTEFFVRNLAEGIGTIAAAFYPNPVIVRLSDFKTNEYAQLIGGADFEPREANPMLGFRGASRYSHPAYEEGFALECAALRRVRAEMGLTNVAIMVPFCRRVEEAERTLAVMAKHGLRRGEDGLEIYVMCEIPNNVIQIDAFARLFDGFSIGSNDLTQLTLGVDRDSDVVAFDFDERDAGMYEMFRLAITGAKRNGRHVGICGEAPGHFPEVARFLVELGIDSISVSPSSLQRTIRAVRDAEQAGDHPDLPSLFPRVACAN